MGSVQFNSVAQSCLTLCDPMNCSTPGLPVHQIQSMAFSRPEYCSGLPFPSPGGLPNPGIKPRSLALQADSLPFEPPGTPRLKCDTAALAPALNFVKSQSRWNQC